jgi:two-component system, NarL family, nitrate/nitrite response regulator NarL
VHDAIRVRVAVSDTARADALSRMLAEAGHQVVADRPEVIVADSVAADADASPPGGPPMLIVGGDPEAAAPGILPERPSLDMLDAAVRALAVGLSVRPAEGGRRRRGFAPAEDAALTPREVEVLTWVGAGLSNKEVARQLGISAHTVKFHMEAAFRKLGAASRAEAVAKGLRRGLIEV